MKPSSKRNSAHCSRSPLQRGKKSFAIIDNYDPSTTSSNNRSGGVLNDELRDENIPFSNEESYEF